MSQNYTPGPWTVGKANRIQAELLVLIGEREIAARPSNIPGEYGREQTANARLIAASPELLKACEQLLYRLKGETSNIESCDVSSGTLLAIERGEAAIQKATGI